MKIFLDIGGHHGETAKIALEKKYDFDRVYSFEPVHECCEIIKKMDDKRLSVQEFGLWDRDCVKKLYAPGSKGASVYKDKFKKRVGSRTIKLKSASKWFKKNIKESDNVYLKINCEGAEIAILEDLIRSKEYKKIAVLMVDFDVRKIPSQKHLMGKMKKKLNKLGIYNIFYIDEYHLGKGTHSYFTHYWLDNS